MTSARYLTQSPVATFKMLLLTLATLFLLGGLVIHPMNTGGTTPTSCNATLSMIK